MMTREGNSVGELDLIYKLAPVSHADADNGSFSGHASVFHYLDYHNDIMAVGSYRDDIPRFLDKGFIGGVGHDHNNPIGRPERLFEDAKGLFLSAKLISTSKAQEAREMITSRVVQELSVGILPLQAKRLTKQDVLDYWKKAGWTPSEEELMRAENGARLIKRAKLLEISPVALGANELTKITSFKSVDSDPLVDVYARLDALEATLKSLTTVSATEADEFTEALEGFRNFLGES